MDCFATSFNNVFKYAIFIVIVLKFDNIPTTFSRASKEYRICSKTFTCGNLTGLSYPFYGVGRPQYCGHPGFELLGCDQYTSKIQIKILSQTFYVFGINQTTSIMNVTRQDFFDGSGCPLTLTNITIDFTKFQYTSSDANISLVYNDSCASNCSSFSCPMGGGNPVPICFLTDKMMQKLNTSLSRGGNCTNSRLFLPVHEADVVAMDNAGRYLTLAAWNGFELKWRADDVSCRQCRGSGGQCGYDFKDKKFFCFCSDASKCPFPGSTLDMGRKIAGIGMTKFIVLVACLSASAICALAVLIIFLKRRSSSKEQRERREKRVSVEAFLRGQGSSGPKWYTYNDLKKITNAFKDKLGEGGYGSVYKGTLQNGKLVAVKMLHKSKEEAEEFINEVASIGNTNHVNVVKLFGFCYEGQRRALVYEFMINGSLEKFLYKGENDSHSLGWTTLFNISVGVARGLEYLHRGCNTRILHFDIKPHNILLDENFCPKISDFGLAKSCPQKDSIISMSEARGTVGYIAPEVFLKSFGGVSYKSDVYSYGMLVLEMVGCRRKVDDVGEVSSEQSFPQWIYEQLEVGEENEHEMVEVDEEMEMQRKMIVVSLWCVKTNPSSRPTMSEVVEMLEAKTQTLQIPRASSLSLSLSTRSQH